jgi:hypothetical protein
MEWGKRVDFQLIIHSPALPTNRSSPPRGYLLDPSLLACTTTTPCITTQPLSLIKVDLTNLMARKPTIPEQGSRLYSSFSSATKSRQHGPKDISSLLGHDRAKYKYHQRQQSLVKTWYEAVPQPEKSGTGLCRDARALPRLRCYN